VRTAIRKHLRDFVAIVVLAVVSIGVGGFVLAHQRLRFPFIQAKTFKLKAEMQTAQAVVAGQGQTVRVAGVRIGDIGGVSLKDGRAIVSMDIDPEYKHLIHTDATALLRPKTGLKDMFLEVNPGTNSAPVAKRNWTIPVRNTLPDVNPDEIFSVLDSDTRDYLKLLVNGAGRGLQGRGADLQDVFRRFEPTHRDLARVTSAVATRRANLRRLIHSLNLLNAQLASRKDDLAQLIDTSAVVFRAFAAEGRNISRAVGDFPGTLRQTTRTLGEVQTFADVLGPTADKLRPAVRSLNKANAAIIPFARQTTPILRRQIRPFVRHARPVVRDLRPAAPNLARAAPDLTTSFTVLNHLFNMVGFNPAGHDPPGANPGYLFVLAWLTHQGANLFSSGDANGPFRPAFVAGTCNILASQDPNFLTALNLLQQPLPPPAPPQLLPGICS
jgi:phospholipid/cholesterol/gamma-HCH transport system substrate-binding protein